MINAAMAQEQPFGLREHVGNALDILVLDDNELDLRRIQRMFERLGRQVALCCCNSFEQFKRFFDSKDYDLCMIDHSLGDGQTSSDVLDYIKTHRTGAFTPAFLVSGTTDGTDVAQAMEAGFSGFVDKTDLSRERLEELISKAMDRSAKGTLSDLERMHLVSRVMDGVSSTYTENTKPALETVLKQANFVRKCLKKRTFPSLEAVDEIEKSCHKVLLFLEDLGHSRLVRHRPPSRRQRKQKSDPKR